MATAPLAAAEEAPDEDTEDVAESVDYPTEAARFGWTSKEEFKGDPTRWVDAETFVKRSQEIMPILKAQNRTLVKRLDAMERASKQSADFFSKAEERAYTRALEQIRGEQEAAVESGDLDAHRKAAKKLDDLQAEHKPPADNDDSERRAEDFADWGMANKWYATNPVMQAYADAQAQSLAKGKKGFLDPADLAVVTERVRVKFEDDFPEAFEAKPRARPRSPVEGVSQSRPRASGHTFNDLPPEAKALCDRWVKNGTIKSRDDYVRSFDFVGYKS